VSGFIIKKFFEQTGLFNIKNSTFNLLFRKFFWIWSFYELWFCVVIVRFQVFFINLSRIYCPNTSLLPVCFWCHHCMLIWDGTNFSFSTKNSLAFSTQNVYGTISFKNVIFYSEFFDFVSVYFHSRYLVTVWLLIAFRAKSIIHVLSSLVVIQTLCWSACLKAEWWWTVWNMNTSVRLFVWFTSYVFVFHNRNDYYVVW